MNMLCFNELTRKTALYTLIRLTYILIYGNHLIFSCLINRELRVALNFLGQAEFKLHQQMYFTSE